jgi:hypothetical protein
MFISSNKKATHSLGGRFQNCFLSQQLKHFSPSRQVSGRDFSRAVSALTRIGLQPLSCYFGLVAPALLPVEVLGSELYLDEIWFTWNDVDRGRPRLRPALSLLKCFRVKSNEVDGDKLIASCQLLAAFLRLVWPRAKSQEPLAKVN